MQAIVRKDDILKYITYVETVATNLKQGSCRNDLYIEHSGIISMAIFNVQDNEERRTFLCFMVKFYRH